MGERLSFRLKPEATRLGLASVALSLILSLPALAGRSEPQSPDTSWPVRLTDVAESAGLTHPSVYGGLERKRFILETNGCGTGFIDYDGDGWPAAPRPSGTRLSEGSRR